MDWKMILALGLLLGAAATVPPAGATGHHNVELTAFTVGFGGTAGCHGGATIAAAALPGQPDSTQSIAGCRTVAFTKPATADVQVAILGGDNTFTCDWRPLERVTCSGRWLQSDSTTVVQLRIMSGTPGSVTASAV
jgi:hypothetical protein